MNIEQAEPLIIRASGVETVDGVQVSVVVTIVPVNSRPLAHPKHMWNVLMCSPLVNDLAGRLGNLAVIARNVAEETGR